MKPEEFVRKWLECIPVWSEATRDRMLTDITAVIQAAVEEERDACEEIADLWPERLAIWSDAEERAADGIAAAIRERGKPCE